jgi:hypothetical protein
MQVRYLIYMKNKKFTKYFKEYEWSNISAMIRNNRLNPQICNEDYNNKTVVITGATSAIILPENMPLREQTLFA